MANTTKLTKLDKALDVIADVFCDMNEGKVTTINDGTDHSPKNKQAWAQRDFLQSLAWKANLALDRANGPDQRMTAIRAAAKELAQTPINEIDMEVANRIARDSEFWGFQQEALEGMMKAANDCLVRHGHEAYVRQDLTKRRTTSNDNPITDQKGVAAMLSGLGVVLPQEV